MNTPKKPIFKMKKSTTNLVLRIASIARNRLLEQIRVMLDQVDTPLFDAFKNAENYKDEELFFDGIQILRHIKTDIEKDFIDNVNETLRHLAPQIFKNNKQEAEIDKQKTLNLVSHNEIEEKITTINIIARASDGHYPEYHALQKRLQEIVIGEKEEYSGILSAEEITLSFVRVINKHKLHKKVKMIIYELFEKIVLEELNSTYVQLNDILIHAGILPVIKIEKYKDGDKEGKFKYKAYTDSPSEDTIETSKREQVEPPKNSSPNQESSLSENESGQGKYYSTFISRKSDAKYSFKNTAISTPFPSLDLPKGIDFHGALSVLQSHVAGMEVLNDDQINPYSIKNQILDMSRSTAGTGEHCADERTIDMVATVFDFVLEDENVPKSIKGLLARLQIPVMKIAIFDESFFKKNEHPARHLLNAIAKASVGWNKDIECFDQEFLTTVTSIVERVLCDFQDNMKIFKEILNEFLAFEEKEKKRSSVIEKRTRKAAKGMDKSNKIKEKIDIVISEYVDIENMPKFLQEYFLKTWKQGMLITAMRFSEDSQEWKSAIDSIATLVWSMQPKRDKEDIKNLITKLPEILMSIRDIMKTSFVNEEMTREFMDKLSLIHLNVLRGANDDANHLSQDLETIKQHIIETQKSMEKNSDEAADNIFDLAAQELQEGAWIEFTCDTGEVLRGKLTWKSSNNNEYIFVNRKGSRVAKKTMADIGGEFKSGHARILDSEPVLEKAIESLSTSDGFNENEKQTIH